MATYKDLQDRIALDYLNRYDLIAEVKRAIRSSVRCYETRRFWFNETATSTATTANSSSLGLPSDFLILDRLEIAYSGSQIPLIQTDFDCIRQMNAVSATGVPTHFAHRANRLELAIVPDSAYSATAYYVHSLPELSADTDTNIWTNEAQNLIAHAAAIEIIGCNLNVFDRSLLDKHEVLRRMALNELETRNTTRVTSRLRATSF